MCDPVSITLGAVSIGAQAGSAILNHKAQNQAANAENAYNAVRQRQVTASANESAAYENKLLDAQSQQEAVSADQMIQQIQLRRSQEVQAARQSVVQTARASQMSQATAHLSAGAAGVSGASVTALLTDVQRQEGDAKVGIGRNLTMTTQQLDQQSNIAGQNAAIAQQNITLQREGVEVNRKNRIAEVSDVPTAPKANPWLTGLQIVGAGIDAVNQYRPLLKPKVKGP